MIHLKSSGIGASDWRPRHEKHYQKSDTSQPAAETAVYLFDDWFDPLEAGVRDRVLNPSRRWSRASWICGTGAPAIWPALEVMERRCQKGLLALKNMGGETTEAWLAVLDGLVDRGLRRPAFLIVDGAPGLQELPGDLPLSKRMISRVS